MKPSKRVIEFYREENHCNQNENNYPDGLVNKTDVRLVEKNILKIAPLARKGSKPLHMIGKNGLADYLKMVGLLPKGE